MIKFGIETKSSPSLSTGNFEEAIIEAIDEVYVMCETTW
jgi:hypothetical protein